jgi:hypothetical protein
MINGSGDHVGTDCDLLDALRSMVTICTACLRTIMSEFFPHSSFMDSIQFSAEILIILVNVSVLLIHMQCRSDILKYNVNECRTYSC